MEEYPEALMIPMNDGSLPTHSAFHSNASESTISLLHETSPMSVTIQSDSGCLPIHHALWSHASDSVIKMLLETYPMSSRVQDNWGSLPIHIAAMVYESEDLFLMLVDAYPESVTITCHAGSRPVDYYLGSIHGDDIRPLQQQQNQPQKDSKDNKGDILFKALERNASYDEVKNKIQKQPDAVQSRNKLGLSLLHESIMHGSSEDTVMLLFELYCTSRYYLMLTH